MSDVIAARVLHVIALVIWIGGVSLVTTVLLPAIRRGEFGNDRLRAFEAIEQRFIWLARVAALIVGLTGIYMTARLDLWERFLSPGYWWMHAMVCLWLLFAFVLFIGEPLFLHRRFEARARANPHAAFALLQRVHWALLTMSLITILGAVAGSHGW